MAARNSFEGRNALLLLAPSLLLMLAIFAWPLILFFNNSFYSFVDGKLIEELSFSSYIQFFSDPFYYSIIWGTLKLSTVVTLITLLIGYPVAYALYKAKNPRLQQWMAVIIFSPLLVSVVVRTYGWLILLSDQGIVNYALVKLGLEPVRLAFDFAGVIISLVHIYLPFMVFPIYSVLLKLNPALKEASSDLGASWWKTFTRITVPLSMPGVIAGAQMCFTLTMGAFVTPSLLGGGRVQVLPLFIYRNVLDINWPMGSVAGMVLLILAIITVMIFDRVLKYYTPA